MRQSQGFILSFLFHVGLGVLAVYGLPYTGVSVNLDMPVYTVDLVSLAPPPPGPPVEVKAMPEPVPQTPEVPVVKARSEPAVEVPAAPVVEAKPEPEPKVEEISPKKVEKKVVKKKEEEKPKPEPKPKARPKPKKTAKQLLAEGMAAAKAETKRQEAKQARTLASELAALKKREGDEVYAHGGQPGGVEGGVEGGHVGGTGSGLSEVYALIVGSAIKKNWRYPSFAGEANLVVSIEVALDGEGTILTSKVLESSGNSEFDNSALRAIKETESVERPRTQRDRILRINFNSQELAE
ncbi:MAG: TonB family protein [Desulfovibrionaceae bacterium]|nr:TonB family protein [Desulfovibrionaceae bacterium]